MYFGTTRFDLTPESGKSMGLDLVIDAHTDQVTSSVTTPFQVNSKFVVKKEDMLKIANTYIFQGFEVLIDSRMEYPMMSGAILIRPGHIVSNVHLFHWNNILCIHNDLQNEIMVESVQVTSDPDIESISPMRRGCLFNHEQPENYTLRAHKKYTQVKLNQGDE